MKEKSLFCLFAVVVHIGTFEGGHYVVYIKGSFLIFKVTFEGSLYTHFHHFITFNNN